MNVQSNPLLYETLKHFEKLQTGLDALEESKKQMGTQYAELVVKTAHNIVPLLDGIPRTAALSALTFALAGLKTGIFEEESPSIIKLRKPATGKAGKAAKP